MQFLRQFFGLGRLFYIFVLYGFFIVSSAVVSVPLVAKKAPEAKLVLQHKDWQVYVMEHGPKKRTCFAMTKPILSEGKYKKRGNPYLMVYRDQASGIKDQLQFQAGYRYAPGCDQSRSKKCLVSFVVDKKNKFDFYTDHDVATTFHKDEDVITKALKRGNHVVIKGKSSRGTLTTDRISLFGFSKAYREMQRKCPM